jgi:hypothetical protein
MVTVPAGPLVTGPEKMKLNDSAVASGVIVSAAAIANSAKTTFFVLIVFLFLFLVLVLVPFVRALWGSTRLSSESHRCCVIHLNTAEYLPAGRCDGKDPVA